MLYDVYEVQSAFVAPFRAMAGATASRLRDLQADGNDIRAFRYFGAACELLSRAHLNHVRPPFGIESAPEEVVYSTPFSTLLHFAKERPAARASGARRRAPVGTFRDPAAQHRAHPARRLRRLPHRLAQRP